MCAIVVSALQDEKSTPKVLHANRTRLSKLTVQEVRAQERHEILAVVMETSRSFLIKYDHAYSHNLINRFRYGRRVGPSQCPAVMVSSASLLFTSVVKELCAPPRYFYIVLHLPAQHPADVRDMTLVRGPTRDSVITTTRVTGCSCLGRPKPIVNTPLEPCGLDGHGHFSRRSLVR